MSSSVLSWIGHWLGLVHCSSWVGVAGILETDNSRKLANVAVFVTLLVTVWTEHTATTNPLASHAVGIWKRNVCEGTDKRNAGRDTVISRYRHTRYRHNHDTGTLFRCTNFPPPNRLRYRHWHTTLQAHKKAICACNEFWHDRPLWADNCFKRRF